MLENAQDEWSYRLVSIGFNSVQSSVKESYTSALFPALKILLPVTNIYLSLKEQAEWPILWYAKGFLSILKNYSIVVL